MLLLTQQKTPKKYKPVGMVIAKQKQPPLRVNINGLKMQAIAHLSQQLQGAVIKAKPTTKAVQGAVIYNRPQKQGSCLTVWQWLDLNPHATKKAAIAALTSVHPTTVGVQYGHWCKAQQRARNAA